MSIRVPRAPLAALPLALLATSVPVALHAQQIPTLEQVVVSATRFAEPLAALPLGVSVIEAPQIRASGATTVNEAVMRLLGVPGRQDLYGGGDYSLDLRGFGATAGSNQVVVLDGVRLNEADLGGTRLAGIPIESVERIEVLRGSGAVLYGEGATGGVIVITTKAGLGKQARNAATAYVAAGTHDMLETRAGATLAARGFTLDVAGHRRDSDNHRDNFASRTDGADVTAQWSGDALRLGARHGRDALDTRLPGSLTAAQYATNPRQTLTPNDFAAIRNQRSGVFAEALVGDWQFALDYGWRDKRLDSTQSGFRFGYDIDAEQTALRARHETSRDGLRNALVVGHDIGRWRREDFSATVASQDTRAWYLKNDLTLAGGTRLSAGARTEALRKQANGGSSRLDDRLSAWELGLSRPLSPAHTVWARVGTSFRLANVDEFSFLSPGAIIRPQTSRDLEAGWRGRAGALRAEARVYRSTLTDEIGFDPAAPGPFGPGANVNFDPTRRSGIELDADWSATPSLSLGVRLAMRRATFRSGPYSGSDVPLAPRQSLALRADWSPAAGHRLGGGITRVGTQFPDYANQCRMPAYTTVDARYAWQHRQMELSLGVNNLLDRDYYTLAFRCAGGQPSAIYPEAGRTFTAALRLAF